MNRRGLKGEGFQKELKERDTREGERRVLERMKRKGFWRG